VLLRVLLLGAVRAALLLLWLLRLRRFEDLQCYYRACITAAAQQAAQSTTCAVASQQQLNNKPT
jgi:hypothetical protein